MITAVKKQILSFHPGGKYRLVNVNIKKGFGGIVDCDGNIYTSVIIGTQEWLVENFKSTCYADGSPITNITNGPLWVADATGAYCWYNNLIAYKTNWGALYNWYAVNNSAGLALIGWRIPTDADWTVLTTFLGGLGVAGGKLKVIDVAYWSNPNTGATDQYGFRKQGDGLRDENTGAFTATKSYGYCWSATEYDANRAYARAWSYNNDDVLRAYYDKNVGFAVRCMRDI